MYHQPKAVIVVVGLTLAHRYNAFRGHRTSSTISGVGDSHITKEKDETLMHTITEASRIAQTKTKLKVQMSVLVR